MEKLTLSIDHREFIIDIEKRYYKDLLNVLQCNNLSIEKNNNISTLLTSYIENILSTIEKEQYINNLINTIDENR
jgi:hypothetical protein